MRVIAFSYCGVHQAKAAFKGAVAKSRPLCLARCGPLTGFRKGDVVLSTSCVNRPPMPFVDRCFNREGKHDYLILCADRRESEARCANRDPKTQSVRGLFRGAEFSFRCDGRGIDPGSRHCLERTSDSWLSDRNRCFRVHWPVVMSHFWLCACLWFTAPYPRVAPCVADETASASVCRQAESKRGITLPGGTQVSARRVLHPSQIHSQPPTTSAFAKGYYVRCSRHVSPTCSQL